MRYAPTSPDEDTDERFVYALQNIGYAEYTFHTSSRIRQAGRDNSPTTRRSRQTLTASTTACQAVARVLSP